MADGDYIDYSEPYLHSARVSVVTAGSGTASRLRRRRHAGEAVGASWPVSVTVVNLGETPATIRFVQHGTDADPTANSGTVSLTTANGTVTSVTIAGMGTVPLTMSPSRLYLDVVSVSGASALRLDMSSRARFDIIPQTEYDVAQNTGVWRGIGPILEVGEAIPDTTVEAFSEFSYTIPSTAFYSLGAGAITLSLQHGDEWLSFSGGVLSGTPDLDYRGRNLVTIRASAGSTYVDQSFVITVVYHNQTPVSVLNSISSLTVGDTWNVDLAALFTDSEHDTLTYAVTGLPTWASVTDGIITATVDDTMVGDYNMVATCTDQDGALATTSVDLIVSPAVSLETAQVGTEYSFDTTALFSGTGYDISAEDLPSWATISSGMITGTPTSEDVGTSILTISALDGGVVHIARLSISVSED